MFSERINRKYFFSFDYGSWSLAAKKAKVFTSHIGGKDFLRFLLYELNGIYLIECATNVH